MKSRRTDFQEEQLGILRSIDTKLGVLIKTLGSDALPEIPTQHIPPTTTELDPHTWLNVAHEYVGLNEHRDTDAIIEMLSKGGIHNLDPTEVSWCAAFVGAILRIAGLEAPHTLRANDYATYGSECEEKVGAIVVYKSHVGFVPELGKVLGGNQSNSVNIGEQSWYGTPEIYRWPV